jgi:hypothetical protein
LRAAFVAPARRLATPRIDFDPRSPSRTLREPVPKPCWRRTRSRTSLRRQRSRRRATRIQMGTVELGECFVDTRRTWPKPCSLDCLSRGRVRPSSNPGRSG